MQGTNLDAPSMELSLRDYVAILVRHKWLVGAIVLGMLALSAAWTVVTPSRYESTSAVVLRTNNNQQLFPSVGASQRIEFIRTPEAELEYVLSSFFASQANLVAPPGTSVRARYEEGDRGRSSQIEFIASADNPLDAQTAAAVWADQYLISRAADDIDEVAATIQSTEALISELELEKAELLEPIKPIDDALLEETDPDVISRLTTQRLSLRQSLEDDLLPVTLQLRTLSQDLSSMRISFEYVNREDNSARLAIVPKLGRKVAPRSSRNLALGALLGLMGAIGAALVNESFRGVINGASDLASMAPNVPVLAQIPEFGRRTNEPLDLAANPGTPYAQAYERVVSALLYERLSHEGRRMSVLVTSSVAGEGKTTVASHLALRLGSTPTSAILLDGDLRRPDVHTTFGEPQAVRGLSHLLQDRQPLAPMLRPLERAPRVRALFAGAATDDAAALLRQAFPAALRSLDNEFDLLLVDAPPVLAVTDAEVMAHSVDAVVVAVRAGKTSRSQLAETLRKLAAVDAKVLGFVLVAVSANGGYGYSYAYDYQSNGTGQQLKYEPERHEQPRAAVEPPRAQERRPKKRAADPAAGSPASKNGSRRASERRSKAFRGHAETSPTERPRQQASAKPAAPQRPKRTKQPRGSDASPARDSDQLWADAFDLPDPPLSE